MVCDRLIAFDNKTHYKSCIIALTIQIYVVCISVSEDLCNRKCWEFLPRKQIIGGQHVLNISDETLCKDLCANNGTCVGIDWNHNLESVDFGCWFQMTPTTEYHPYNNTDHWNLVNCSDECLPYCWNPVKVNSHALNGQNVGNMDENQCKLFCSKTSNCTGLDWDQSGCYLFYSAVNISSKANVHHWDIVRNSTTNCPQTTIFASTKSNSIDGISNGDTTVALTPGNVDPNIRSSSDGNLEESFKRATIALAVLLGVSVIIIIALIINTFRIRRQQHSNPDIKEAERTYEDLRRDGATHGSQDPSYTELQPKELSYVNVADN